MNQEITSIFIFITEGFSLGIPSTPVDTTTSFFTSSFELLSMSIMPLPVLPKTKSPEETVPSVILFPCEIIFWFHFTGLVLNGVSS